MRRFINFLCEGSQCAATLDEAAGADGLLIVSGGNEIRIGAHRGMAKLARDMAAAGHPVFRFDRRGIGDSAGNNDGFDHCGPDIAAALAAFRAACPQLRRIIAFGNCDAASALVLHQPLAVDAVILANPWVIEPVDDLPPAAAIRARYAERLRDPKAWMQLLSGAINLRKLASGLMRIAKPEAPSSLAGRVIDGIKSYRGDLMIMLATGDATAIAFADAWNKARGRQYADIVKIDSRSHSFASDVDYAALRTEIEAAFKRQ